MTVACCCGEVGMRLEVHEELPSSCVGRTESN